MLRRPIRLALAASPGLLGLLFWLALRASQTTSDCPTPSPLAYKTPFAAALDATWRNLQAPVPHHIALNVLPSIQLDTQRLNADVSRWHAKLDLFRDTAWFAHDMITADSLRSWHLVFDVRTLSPSEWNAYWTMLASAFTMTKDDSQHLDHLGAVYRVADEVSRGWPGHDDFYFEIRQTSRGYVACQLLASGSE